MRTVTVEPSLAGGTSQSYYGHVVSLMRMPGHGFLMRYDPAWFLSGITANVAAAQDEHLSCAPVACRPVPNDNYVVEESHRTLTFRVPSSVRGYVLTPKAYLQGTNVGVAELARLVAGTSALKLFEPLDSGIWIRVRGDTVLTFEQQFRP